MNDRRFDTMSKRLGSGVSRRTVLKAMLGIGALSTTAALVQDQTEAARRGFSGPKFPWDVTPTPPVCFPDGEFCFLWEPDSCCSGICAAYPISPGGGICRS